MKKMLVLLCLVLPTLSWAHAVFEQNEVVNGSYYKGTIGIGHGCQGESTTQVTIEIPEGVQHAKPMPKAGWQIDIKTMPLTKPYDSHGKTVTDDVRYITWFGGNLSDDTYDEFVIKSRIDSDKEVLFFPVTQTCVRGVNDWKEVPEKLEKWHEKAFPAPYLKILPSQQHKHH